MSGILSEIKLQLKEKRPELAESQRKRMYQILNSENQDFECYGLKVSVIEQIIKAIYKGYKPAYEEAIKIFENLMSSNIQDEKFAGFFFINQFKQEFNSSIIDLFRECLEKNCDNWAVCDSFCIRVIGPFLAKQNELAQKTIESWLNSEKMWVRRAALVILLKIIMVKKEFDEDYVFGIVQKIQDQSDDYIQKGIGWLLKTCSKYKADVIYDFLMRKKDNLSRLVLRYGSEKLSKERRKRVLEK